MDLIIVESPHKAKTIEKFLKGKYKVDASKGHVRDLPVNYLGVNLNNNFEPYYVITPEKKKDIKRLSEEAAKADKIYLATDPDREGEAISWHLKEVLGLSEEQVNRIEFNEISEKAVSEALAHPRKIDQNLVNAQQARRVLDRIVGYTVSPVASSRLNESLSAGRVQSVALKMVVDREREIQAFKPQEYWNLKAELKGENKNSFKALLSEKNGKKYKPGNAEEAEKVENELKNSQFKVKTVKKTVVKSHAPAPFITSTMQQDGSIKLGVTAPQIMAIAQRLYEGVETPQGNVALITYMRTDSVRISSEAQSAARKFIADNYGKEYLPEKPNFYKTKSDAQDAHEAIRPIDVNKTPDSVKNILDKNQYKLYKLIYERFIASQMNEAIYNSVAIDVAAGEYVLKTSGKTLTFKGYTAVYDDTKKDEDDESGNSLIPPLTEGELLDLIKLIKEQKFTKPPTRYTEASLIKNMEDKGIGRPSTYATIMAKLSDKKREYVKKEKKYLVPNPISYELIDFLVKYFPDIMDISFTAKMEDELDDVGSNGKDWHQLISDFYTPFEKELNASKMTDKLCDKCGAPMIIKSGKYGSYYACSNYPECKNIKPVNEKVVIPTDRICPNCGSIMVEREGKFGKFLACSNFPKCKTTLSLTESVGVCPECGKPTKKMVSRGGKVFYGCSDYPNCKFMSWDIPTGKKCPKCGAYLISVNDKVKCSNKKCDYKE
ncbi:MAG: type I DNA topoisomerase [Candidatus Borkfalkiaceae bacterium]|nr:type I DNA topoisomerase [Christensenellaceae bacterium]